MKRKSISILVMLSMAAALGAVLSCHCVGGDCQSVPREVQAAAPQCHHGASQPRSERGASDECCGKCRLDQAVLFDTKLLLMNPVRSWTVPAKKSAVTTGLPERTDAASFFTGPGLGPPGSFFIRHILNAAIAFRAPPKGDLGFAL